MAKPPILAVILDGLGDRPHPDLGDRTPLEAATTPTLDELAERSAVGLVDPLAPGIVPGSNTGHLALFGYDPLAEDSPSPSRGCIEALGLEIDPKPGRVAARANFVTLAEDGTIADRRAGRFPTARDHEEARRIVEGIDEALPEDAHARYHPRLAYRCVLVFDEASPNVTDTDPGEVGKAPRPAEPAGNADADATAAKRVRDALETASEVLDGHPVNQRRADRGAPRVDAIVTRGLGEVGRGQTLGDRYGIEAVGIAGGNAYRGIANYVGMDLADVEGATGGLDTDLDAKVDRALAELDAYDMVYLHVKAPDILGENGDPEGKRDAIGAIDEALEPLVGRRDVLVGLTGDHSTPCARKSHSGDPVPLLVDGPGVRTDRVEVFGERACQAGGLGRLVGGDFLHTLLDLTDRTKKRE